MKVVICGPVKNCGPYLPRVLSNMHALGTLFEKYVIIISSDRSVDNSIAILRRHRDANPATVVLLEHNGVMSPYRTHNISRARNSCLDYANTHYGSHEYMIMMDCDDVNCKRLNVEPIKRSLAQPWWDSISFNTVPRYYDIWALSISPYTFSYNHFPENQKQYVAIQRYITSLLAKRPIVPCISAFNGFAIYRLSKFRDCRYNGNFNPKLLPPALLNQHIHAVKSRIIIKNYGNVNGAHEDCEHRAFHVSAIQKHRARNFISREVVFY